MTALVFALAFEAGGLRGKGACLPGCEIWTLQVAGRRAAEALSERIESGRAPDIVVSAGLAGALDPELSVGDLLRDAAGIALPGLDPGIPDGNFHTAETIVATVEEKRRLRERTGADACDMESGHIAALCQKTGIPYAGLRCISDDASRCLPVPPETLIHPGTGKPDPVRLATTLIVRPARLPGFLRAIREAARARALLAEALAAAFGGEAS